MHRDDMQALIGFLQKKAELLVQYESLSMRILVDDFDRLEHLLDVRHGFLLEFNEITPKIEKIISRCVLPEQEELQSLLKYEGLDAQESKYSEMLPVLRRIKALIASINEKTSQTDRRFRDYREELMRGLNKFSKGQRIVNYMSAAANTDIFRGKHMDGKT